MRDFFHVAAAAGKLTRTAILFPLAALLLAGPASPAGGATPAVTGVARLRFSADRGEGFSENRATQYLRIDARKLFLENVSIMFDGRNELPGRRYASSGRRTNFRLFNGYLAVDDIYKTVSLKAGRQYHDGPDVTPHFDGGAVSAAPARWLKLDGFAGTPVMEMGHRLSDRIHGGSLTLGRGRSGYLQLHNIVAGYSGRYAPDEEYQAAFMRKLWYGSNAKGTFTYWTRVAGSFSYLNRRPKTASLRFTCSFPSISLDLIPEYFAQLFTADPATERLSPYRQAIAYPYRFHRYGIRVSKGFKGGFSVSGGGSYSNPDSRMRYYATLSASDLFTKGFDAVATYGYNSYMENSDLSTTVSAAYRIKPSLRFSAGASYGRNRNKDWSAARDWRTNLIRSYFADLKWSRGRQFDLSVSPSIVTTSASSRPIQHLEISNNWRF